MLSFDPNKRPSISKVQQKLINTFEKKPSESLTKSFKILEYCEKTKETFEIKEKDNTLTIILHQIK